MGDKDEQWMGPVVEGGQPGLDERLLAVEAGEDVGDIIQADMSVEDRLARLERIAEYLHDARKEAVVLAGSVDTLAEAAKGITGLLTTIEEQQVKIEALGDRVDATEADTTEFRDKVVRRAVATGLVLGLFLALVGGGLLAFQRAQDNDAQERCLARNEEADITADTFREVLAVIPEDAPSAAAIRDGLRRFEAIIVPCKGVIP